MSRSAEFNGGFASTRPGTQDDHWANQRYGDQTELPAPTTRRAGPLGPRTAEEERQWQDEIRWSRSH